MRVQQFHTGSLAARDRFGAFSEFAGRSHLTNWLRSDHEDDFRATVRVFGMPDLQVSTLSFPDLEIVRTPQLIRRSDPEVLQVNCVLGGTGTLSVDGRTETFHTGDILLLDSGLPWHGRFSSLPHTWSHLVLQIPRARLPLPDRELRRLYGVPLPGRSGLAGVLHRWLTDLHSRASEFTEAELPTLAATTTDLLTALYGHCLDRGEAGSPESRRRAMLARVRDFIRRELHDPCLSPDTVAAAHHISTRHLHRLFHEQGLTVADWIRRCRLERCRRDLADPLLSARPVQAVASRWGFVDKAHFSRVFRAAYGMPPRDFRRSALSDGSALRGSTTTGDRGHPGPEHGRPGTRSTG